MHRLEVERGESALADGGPVRWSTGPLIWYETSLPKDWRVKGIGRPAAAPSGLVLVSLDPGYVLAALVAESPRHVQVWPAGLHEDRPLLGYWPWILTPLLIAVWLIVFATMLSRSDHRYAGRWAWFWLFTVGQAGVLLYLLLETRPLWTASRRFPSGEPRRPWNGVAGLAASIPLGLVILGIGSGLR